MSLSDDPTDALRILNLTINEDLLIEPMFTTVPCLGLEVRVTDGDAALVASVDPEPAPVRLAGSLLDGPASTLSGIEGYKQLIESTADDE